MVPRMVPDVMHNVVEHLTPVDPPTRPGADTRRDMLRLALVCQDFKELALNELWRSLDTLYPLLALLPTLKVVDDKYVLRGIPSQKYWQRFMYYAQKIQNVEYLGTDSEDPIADSTYLTVFNMGLPHNFLPRLRSIVFSRPQPVFFSLFSGSRQLESSDFSSLSSPQHHPFISNALTVLSQNCERFTTLVLPANLPENIVGLVMDLHRLRFLSLGERECVSLSLLRKLGAMEDLKSLALNLTTESISSSDREMANLGFTKLQKIRFTGHLEVAASLLGGMDCPKLREIEMDFTTQQQPKVETFTSLVRAVGWKWSLSLHLLGITRGSEWNIGDAPGVVFDEVLESLQSVEGLQYLKLDMELPASSTALTVRGMVSFVEEHSQLRFLHLPAFNILPFPVLINTARSCPLLTTLHIRLEIDDLPILQECEVFRNDLQCLSVGNSPRTCNAIDLARRLNRLFPLLETIKSEGDGSERWQTVQALLRFAHATKLDELDRVKARM